MYANMNTFDDMYPWKHTQTMAGSDFNLITQRKCTYIFEDIDPSAMCAP